MAKGITPLTAYPGSLVAAAACMVTILAIENKGANTSAYVGASTLGHYAWMLVGGILPHHACVN
jgi:hypothetical protein